MKKIENILFIPAVILLFLSISKKNTAVTDIHFSDTYYVVSNAAIAGGFLGWLILVIIFLKLIRWRHQSINIKFASPYIILTLVLYLVFTLASPPQAGTGGMSDAQLDQWIFYNRLREVTAVAFILIQVIFLIYFITQLFKRPAVSRQKDGQPARGNFKP
jgi:membrane protease YdiL (CAAX protease family)